MKKQSSRTTSLLKQIFDVRRWADWDRIKVFTAFLGNLLKKLFIPGTSSSAKEQSFDDVTTRMNLSDQDLLRKQKALHRLSYFMCGIAILIFSYSLLQLFSNHIAAFSLSFIVTLIALVLAFRYHYWHYLIKKRKLHCTSREWFRQGLLGEKDE